MKNLFTAILLLLFFSSLAMVNAQPVVSSPANYSIVDESAIITITFTDADNTIAGTSLYDVTFTAVVGSGQLSGSTGVDVTLNNLPFGGVAGTGPYTVDIPAATLADNTVFTYTIDNVGEGAAGASSAITISTGTVLTVGTATVPSSPSSLNPNISWTNASGGFPPYTYDVYVNNLTGSAHAGDVESSLGATSPYTTTAVTSYNEDYFVIIGVTDAAASTLDYAEASFTTYYETPVLTSPVNDAKDVNIGYNVNFTWGASTGATDYRIQISTSSGFGTTVVDQIVSAATLVSLDLSGLDYYTTYYWRVRAEDTNTSEWSTVWHFRTIDNYNPVLFFPSNGATDIPNSSVTLGWGLTNRLDYVSFLFPKFKIVYDKDGSFTPGDGFDPVVVSGVSVTTFFLGLDPGQTYYWKVITVKANNEGESYQTPVTTGALTVGTTYRVTVAGTTDFSAVGGPAAPVIGDEFTVTATSVLALTPTWAGGTELIIAGDAGESATWSFTTSGAVVKPTIAYPKDETTVYSQTPILYWYTTGFNPVHEYEIEWTDDISGFPLSADQTVYGGSTANWKGNIPGLFGYPTPALDGGKHIYWHVRTVIGTTVSDWSDTEDFFTFDGVDAAKPNPAYPTGGVEVYSEFPRLYWTLNGPSQGLTYNVYYVSKTDAEALGGPGSTFDDADTANAAYKKIYNIASLYVTLYDGIVGGETYFWKVQSYNGTIYSDLSDEAEFKIYNFSADLIPILSWPIGGNLVYTTDVNFAWHVEGPSLGLSYDLEVREDLNNDGSGDNLTGVANHPGLSSNLITIPLTAGKSYEWQVKVSSESTWSDPEYFTVISGSGSTIPVLNWPVGGATVWSTSQDLSWTLVGGGSPTFEVQVFTDAGLTTHFTGSPFTSVASSPLNITGLTAGATYYWRVRVEPSEPWSNVEVFIVFAGLSPEAPPTLAPVPRLGSPIDGVEVNTSNPTLSFFSPAYTEGEITYDVEYSKNADFSNSVVKTGLTSPQYNAEGLTSGTYYWRARGKDAEGNYSGYSDQGTFQVTGVTGVKNEEGVPQNYSLSQNYPNPFNPSTVIKYSLPEASYVTLKIYNMLGQEVKTLVSGQSNAGVYTINWNGKDNSGHSVSSGAYIYQIVSGNFVQTRKMILLK